MNNYKKNLQAISTVFPPFADMIKADTGVDWVTPIRKGKLNSANLIIKTSKAPFLVYDKEDPELESQTKAKEMTFHNDAATILFGAGCGYFLKALLDTMASRHVVVLVEPTMQILKLAFELDDFSEHIKSGKLLFACTREDLDYQLTLIESNKTISQWFVPTEDYIKHRPNEYSMLLNHTLMLITQLKSNTGTVGGAGSMIAKNDILNLPHIIQHRGVDELTDLFKDKPAILVSTGPSLQKNIHLLMDKDVQKRFIIIAVGQALRILLSYDIKPDFICSVDFGPVNFGHYKGLLDITDIPLVTSNRSYQPIIKNWSGPKFIAASLDGNSEGTLSDFIAKEKGGLLQGGSVAHMNFGLAIKMGCNPIIMIGQDLAYTDDGRSHHALTDEAGKIDLENNDEIVWTVDDPRSEIQGSHSMGPVQNVNGYFGKPVKTNAGYVSFISTFERMFRDYPEIEIINSTEGGAKLEGARQVLLEDVIDEIIEVNSGDFSSPKIDKSVLQPLLSIRPNATALVNTSKRLAQKDLKELDEIIRLSSLTLNILKKLKGSNKNRLKFQKHIKHSYEYTIACKKLVDKNPLTALSVFFASKAIATSHYSDARQELKEALDSKEKKELDYFYTKEGKEVLKIRIEANSIVMEASNLHAKALKECYVDAIKELKEGVVLDSSINPEPDLSDAEEYFKNGNWGHNLIEAIRCIEIQRMLAKDDINSINHTVLKKCKHQRNVAITKAKENYDTAGKNKIIKYNYLVDKAHKLGKEKQEFDTALTLLEEAFHLDPDRQEAKYGLATVYHRLAHEDPSFNLPSINNYKELIEKYPNHHQYKLELSLVYLQAQMPKEADDLFKIIFKETEEYDYFLKSLAKLYYDAGLIKEAQTAIDSYMEKFSFDSEGQELAGLIANITYN